MSDKLNEGYPIDIDNVEEALKQYGFGNMELTAIWMTLWESPELEIYSTKLNARR